jgi:hypothetical protein
MIYDDNRTPINIGDLLVWCSEGVEYTGIVEPGPSWSGGMKVDRYSIHMLCWMASRIEVVA